MKRKIAFVLAAALMLGLTACGAANGTDSTNNSSVQAETSQSAESGERNDGETAESEETSGEETDAAM